MTKGEGGHLRCGVGGSDIRPQRRPRWTSGGQQGPSLPWGVRLIVNLTGGGFPLLKVLFHPFFPPVFFCR